MESLADRLKMMVKVFRRECHRVLHSERTTIHGADDMLMVLQLAIAEVNKQVTVQTASPQFESLQKPLSTPQGVANRLQRTHSPKVQM